MFLLAPGRTHFLPAIRVAVLLVAAMCLAQDADAKWWHAPPSQVAGLPMPRAMEFSPGLIRGSSPDVAGMEALAAKGVKTDIDLEYRASTVKAEAAEARRLNMNHFSYRMKMVGKPNDSALAFALEMMEDPRNSPVYVHCRYGKDRTGLLVGLFRVFMQGWAPELAYREMRAMDFNPWLIHFKKYFRDRTRWGRFDLVDADPSFPQLLSTSIELDPESDNDSESN